MSVMCPVAFGVSARAYRERCDEALGIAWLGHSVEFRAPRQLDVERGVLDAPVKPAAHIGSRPRVRVPRGHREVVEHRAGQRRRRNAHIEKTACLRVFDPIPQTCGERCWRAVNFLTVGHERLDAHEDLSGRVGAFLVAHQFHRDGPGAGTKPVHATEPLDEAVGGACFDAEVIAVDVRADLDAGGRDEEDR